MTRSSFKVFIILLFFPLIISCTTTSGSSDTRDLKTALNTNILTDDDVKEMSYVAPEEKTITFHKKPEQEHKLVPGGYIVSGVSEKTPCGLLRRIKSVKKLMIK